MVLFLEGSGVARANPGVSREIFSRESVHRKEVGFYSFDLCYATVCPPPPKKKEGSCFGQGPYVSHETKRPNVNRFARINHLRESIFNQLFINLHEMATQGFGGVMVPRWCFTFQTHVFLPRMPLTMRNRAVQNCPCSCASSQPLRLKCPPRSMVPLQQPW